MGTRRRLLVVLGAIFEALILEPLMAAVRSIERFLGPDDDWVEDERKTLFEAAQSHFGHLRTFVREKGTADYVVTADASPDTIERVLDGEGYDRNLASTRKYRTHIDHDSGVENCQRQYAAGAFAKPVPEKIGGLQRQHHVYLFRAPNGRTDVYAHEETSVVEGIEHLTETNQKPGAPHNLFAILESHDISYGKRAIGTDQNT